MRALLTGLVLLLATGAVVFVLLCGLLYWTQDSSIFFPGPNDPGLRQQLRSQRIEIPAAGTTLEGWWLEYPRAGSPLTVLYFGGNAEDVLYTAGTAVNLDARQLIVVNYRGYGGSTGRPSQEALYEDALAIYDFVVGRGVDPNRIVVMGRSLGSAVATMLAASRPVRAAILITPFDSLAAVATGHYPMFPVRVLLRHPFPSSDWARQAHAPALMLAAQHDRIVPPLHAQRLYAAWAGEKQLHVLPGVGHNDIEISPDYYQSINAFLATLAAEGDLPLASPAQP